MHNPSPFFQKEKETKDSSGAFPKERITFPPRGHIKAQSNRRWFLGKPHPHSQFSPRLHQRKFPLFSSSSELTQKQNKKKGAEVRRVHAQARFPRKMRFLAWNAPAPGIARDPPSKLQRGGGSAFAQRLGMPLFYSRTLDWGTGAERQRLKGTRSPMQLLGWRADSPFQGGWGD